LLQHYLIVHDVHKIIIFSEENAKGKLGSFAVFGFDPDPSTERLDNVF
jgi:hypothetical protein